MVLRQSPGPRGTYIHQIQPPISQSSHPIPQTSVPQPGVSQHHLMRSGNGSRNTTISAGYILSDSQIGGERGRTQAKGVNRNYELMPLSLWLVRLGVRDRAWDHSVSQRAHLMPLLRFGVFIEKGRGGV